MDRRPVRLSSSITVVSDLVPYSDWVRRYREARGLEVRTGLPAAPAGSDAVALIPETIARTKLGRLKPGQTVNLEADVIARYLEALMNERRR